MTKTGSPGFDVNLETNIAGQTVTDLKCEDGQWTVELSNGYSLQFESDPSGMFATILDPSGNREDKVLDSLLKELLS